MKRERKNLPFVITFCLSWGVLGAVILSLCLYAWDIPLNLVVISIILWTTIGEVLALLLEKWVD